MSLLRLLLLVWLTVQVIPLRAEPFRPFEAAGIAPRPGAQVPLDATFVDDLGQPVRLGDLLGERPTLLVPVYFKCPNVCGAQLASLFNLLDAVGYRPGVDYRVIAYSFDPRETPADARAERERLARRWPALAHAAAVHLLTGPEAASRAVSDALGFRYRWDPAIEQYAHASAIAVLGAGGQLTRWLYGLGYQPEDLRLALTEAGDGTLGDFTDRLLLLCYHYDPRTGGYDNWVIGALQVGGIGTALALAGFIGLSLWRERRAGRAGNG